MMPADRRKRGDGPLTPTATYNARPRPFHQRLDRFSIILYVLNQVRTSRQLELTLRTWGGRRRGAGRKPAPGRRRMSHRRRPVHDRQCPAHVTLRVRAGLPSLRRGHVFGVVRTALAASSGPSFRLLQFSVQSDHVHALVEGDGPAAFVRGVQGLAIRLAKAVNRAVARRGAVFADRYHVRMLPTPREVRHALVYVLQNFRKHVGDARGLDACSSARWFTGWATAIEPTHATSPVAMPRTWLARVGWLRHGRIPIDEAPRRGRHHRVADTR
jgi:hypothetical protein